MAFLVGGGEGGGGGADIFFFFQRKSADPRPIPMPAGCVCRSVSLPGTVCIDVCPVCPQQSIKEAADHLNRNVSDSDKDILIIPR